MSKRIPKKESDLVALVELMIGGLKAEAEIFKSPPLSIDHLADSINTITLAVDNVAQKKGDYHKAVAQKDKDLNRLYQEAKAIAEYCYRASDDDKTVLDKVGLTPRARKRQVEFPGQCVKFRVLKQEINSVTFHWKEPQDGGAIRVYIIQRKETEAPPTTWTNLWTEVSKKAEIKNQPQGKIFDYRVRALNASGIGVPSNIVTLKF